MRILLDADGVLAELLSVWMQEYRFLTGDMVRVEDIKTYNFESYVQFPHALVAALDSGQVFAQCRPENGAVAGVEHLLQQGHDVRVITYVLEETQTGYEQKRAWLRRWFPEIARKVIFCHSDEKQFVYGDVLVEDRPRTIEQWLARHPFGRAFLVEHSYNADWKGHPRCIRVNNLLEVAGILQKEIEK